MTGIERRLATRKLPFPDGEALFNEQLPAVWDMNFCLVEQPSELSAKKLVDAAERLHRAARHQHRQIRAHDESTGERLEPEFKALGWDREGEVLMALTRTPDREIDTNSVEEVEEVELQPVRAQMIRAEGWADADESAISDLLAAQFLMDDVTTMRRFAARVDGEIRSYCELYTDGATSQIEQVMTLPEYRNRGLARGVVTKAIEEAHRLGGDLIFLTADVDDWPKELYRKMGFDEIGHLYAFRLTSRTLLQALLDSTGASRVTLRQERPGDVMFPVTHEVLAAGVNSIRDGAGIDLRNQPVVTQMLETRAQLVQDDSATAFDDPEFQRMREAYGELASQIVTPIFEDERLVAVISLHQTGTPRTWTSNEKQLAQETADRVRQLVRA